MIEGPPYRIDGANVLANRGIREVRQVRGLAADGRIFWDKDGYVVEVNPRLIPTRRRFTLAHEIGHSFFLPLDVRERAMRSDQATGRFNRRDEEEYLCDVAAAELLMPKDAFVSRVCAYGPSVGSVLALAREFETSLSATARRFAEVEAWKCHIGLWRIVKEGGPKFEFGFASGRLHWAIPREAASTAESMVGIAASERRQVSGWSDMGFVSPRGERLGDVFAEVVPLQGPGLLMSMTIFEKHPEMLVNMRENTGSSRALKARDQGAFVFRANSDRREG